MIGACLRELQRDGQLIAQTHDVSQVSSQPARQFAKGSRIAGRAQMASETRLQQMFQQIITTNCLLDHLILTFLESLHPNRVR